MSGLDLLVRVLVCGLGAWRLSALAAYETGPLDIFDRLRRWIGIRPLEPIEGFFPLLFSCIWCLSVWAGTALWFAWELSPAIPAVPAVWAVAIATERIARP